MALILISFLWESILCHSSSHVDVGLVFVGEAFQEEGDDEELYQDYQLEEP